MSKERIFFQDFLFDNLPVDNHEHPVVEINRLPPDINSSNCVILSFDRLLRMNHSYEWDTIFNAVKDKTVCIKDDVVINNCELLTYKDFYLKTYIFNLRCYCQECYVS